MDNIYLLEKIFRNTDNCPRQLEDLFSDLSNWNYATHNGYYLHPCVINGKSAIVCQRELSSTHPDAFTALQAITDRYGLFLKEDNRIQDNSSIYNRRQGIAIMLTFCISLLASSRLVSATEIQPATTINVLTHLSLPLNAIQAKVSIHADGTKILSLKHVSLPSATTVLDEHRKKYDLLAVNTSAETMIKEFLLAAYSQTDHDPNRILDDFTNLANYYAHFPQVIALFNVLINKEMQLRYKPGSWQTQAWGSKDTVDRVTIYFDTRSAAQFVNGDECATNPACNISPADALLHELLHAKLMLVDSQEFFKSGGLKPTLYPIEHERTVISYENQLYQAMNQLDGLARPLRSRHSGAIIHVDCALCMLANNASTN